MRELDGARVLVTGGSGFIGRSLVTALLAGGAEVVVADLVEYPDDAVECVTGDLCEPEVRRKAVSSGLDAVVHLAAVTSVLRSVTDPAGTHRLNVEATADLLELSREQEVPSFVLASTNAVTGDVGTTPINEDLAPRPLTPYGATKAAGEMLLNAYAASYGMRACALRFANVYGPGMRHKDSLVPRLMRAAAGGTGVQVYGDGTQLRDYVHVGDVVQAVLLALRTGHTGPLVVGSGRSVSVNDLIEAARQVTGRPIPVEQVPAKQGEMPAVVLDISRARALGYRPRHDLPDGMADVWPEFAEGEVVV
ncbi:NAD-dependent epimerase/dehydratase family protein [Nonomuraea sp. K274]|uniref:NAD-dependent epimerase/dehydratase family protein n=1 Tax=Nonomuraea cypriaca TaxID=1187855 RepID=A0A931EZC6_9ACTN|nr:NAD-dependent epimerase/dehydratase family protein [Nonomuraea cypriaca]MBF8185048.1 NAD-dependent epimerase/dehydratase family protein [Nonomuraea cypriaca]